MTIELNPAENIALTVGLSQVLRGDEPTRNVASVCILALARLTGRHDYTAASAPETADECGHVWVGSAFEPLKVWCSKCGKVQG